MKMLAILPVEGEQIVIFAHKGNTCFIVMNFILKYS